MNPRRAGTSNQRCSVSDFNPSYLQLEKSVGATRIARVPMLMPRRGKVQPYRMRFPSLLAPTQAAELCVSRAGEKVVVDHPGSLHQCVTNR